MARALLALKTHIALPVVDKDGIIVSTLSTSDLRGCQRTLLSSSSPRATASHLGSLTIREFLVSSHSHHLPPPVLCHPEDSIRSAVSKMIEKRIHRVWVSDDVRGSRRGVGVVSMTDVMRVVFNAEMN